MTALNDALRKESLSLHAVLLNKVALSFSRHSERREESIIVERKKENKILFFLIAESCSSVFCSLSSIFHV